MNIYLKHPDHGTKIASMEMEAEFDEQNGWIRYTDETQSDKPIAAPVNTLEVKRRRKTIE
jgi:hypothetical protein